MDYIIKYQLKGHICKYDDLKLKDIKSFTIKKYNINDFQEYKLYFHIYLNNIISITINKLSKNDIKSNPLIISKYQTKLELDVFQNNFNQHIKNNTLENIFELLKELVILNKINFIEDLKNKSINLTINNKEGKQILKTNIRYIDDDKNLNLNSILYKLNPIFKKKEIITESCEASWSLNRCFSIFNTYHEKEILIIYQNYDNNNIEIMKLINKQIIKTFKNIESKLSFIEHYFNNKDRYDYTVISFRNNIIKIYNISLNYEEILSFENGKSIGMISCCLLLFNEVNLIVSIYGKKKDDYTKIYSLNNIFNDIKNTKNKTKDNISLVKKLPGSNKIIVCTILFWENKTNNKESLVQLGNNKIQINDLSDYNSYYFLNTNEYGNNVFYSGCIYKDTYLICISNEGNIFLWNILSTSLINKISIEKFNLFDCILWSNNYLAISAINKENKNNVIKILDITLFKIINNIYVSDMEGVSCIKKIIHSLKGNCLLSSGENNKIILFSV